MAPTLLGLDRQERDLRRHILLFHANSVTEKTAECVYVCLHLDPRSHVLPHHMLEFAYKRLYCQPNKRT